MMAAEVSACVDRDPRSDGQVRCRRFEVWTTPLTCERCLHQPLHREVLGAAHAMRALEARLTDAGRRFTCYRYGGLAVDAEFCLECRGNPALKQRLAERRPTSRLVSPCIRRREEVGEVEEECCGGKTRMVPTYRCEGHLEPRAVSDCLRCGEYQPPSPFPLPGGEGNNACASWEGLWQSHSGTTALVLCCGPSVLLPGEDPAPDTVDPRTVAADVVISTNWAWKWYADIIDYQVSYDPTPCQGWRPGGIKLLTATRQKDAMAMMERAGVYCFFPPCDYGDIARGKPLPCSRNSGYAALAFAAYAGCSAIKVLGMDFGPRKGRDGQPERMHFYHEGKTDVDRRVQSFGRQRERVQADLTKLLAAIRATGATVENLSPLPGLDWGQDSPEDAQDAPSRPPEG